MEIILQLHGGGGGGGSTVKSSAPGAVAGATIDNQTSEQRQKTADRLKSARGKVASNVTQGNALSDDIKKALLGE